MKRSMRNTMLTGILAAGLALAAPAWSQMGGGMMGQPGGPGAQQMSGALNDMGSRMKAMSDELSKGNVHNQRQKQMAEQLKQMSTMMGEMSGMAGQGMAMDAEMQKRMEEMRTQMGKMGQGAAPKK